VRPGLVIALSVVIAVLTGHAWSAPPGEGWRKIWQDDFSGTKLDSRRWSTDYPWGHTLDHQGYTSGQQVKVRDGQLIITAINQRHPDAPRTVEDNDHNVFSLDYTTGAVHSKHKFSMKPGYIEANMKMPATIGAWPSFFLLRAPSGWPPEIDIMEMPITRRFDMRKYHYAYHFGDDADSEESRQGSLVRGPNFTMGFHTFGVAWGADYMEWYLDNRLVRRMEGEMFSQADRMFPIFNLSIGGWPGTPPDDAVWPAKFRVNWVRAYEFQGSVAGARAVPEPTAALIVALAMACCLSRRTTRA
jgi:beta-glucanase (GH16 family)